MMMKAIFCVVLAAFVFGQSDAALKRVKRQKPFEACKTCETIVNIARHHFHNNINDENALKAQLLQECTNIGQLEGQQAGQHCTMIVNKYIDKIFADMHTNTSAHHTCQDIGECHTPVGTSQMPEEKMLKREKRQGGGDPCRICQIVIGLARHYFNNTVTNEQLLLAQLRTECHVNINRTEGPVAAAHCIRIVQEHIGRIWFEINTQKSPREICVDCHECPAGKRKREVVAKKPVRPVQRVKRQRPDDACRICEIVVNLARFHFHNQVNDQAALQAELLRECNNLGGFEGPDARAHCTRIVNANIAQIFADMSTNKSPVQTCTDIHECRG